MLSLKKLLYIVLIGFTINCCATVEQDPDNWQKKGFPLPFDIDDPEALKELRRDAQESFYKKEQKLIPESQQLKILYDGHLGNVRAHELERNFSQGVIRALSDDECALYYLEWTKRAYEYILHNKDAVLLELACNFPRTAMQKKYERVFIRYLLNFDQRINPSAKAIASMSRGIKFWNTATSYHTTVDDMYLEKVFKNLPEKTVELSLSDFDLKNIPMTDPLSKSDEYQLIYSAQQATSEKYKQLPADADKHDQMLIDETSKAMRAITYHKAMPYNNADSDTIRTEKYNQRYNLALYQFKEASQLIQNPQSHQKLFDTLMYEVRYEYERVYRSSPQPFNEPIRSNFNDFAQWIIEGNFQN